MKCPSWQFRYKIQKEHSKIKITGLDAAIKKLSEIKNIIEKLNGISCFVEFNPHDPASIELAILEMEDTIDQHLKGLTTNSTFESIAQKTKASLREKIIERAVSARLITD